MEKKSNSIPIKKALRSATFKIEPLVKREIHLKLLVYGNYGVGKTYLAGTASQVKSMQNVLLINAEAGDLTLDGDEFHGIDNIPVDSYKTLSTIYEYLVAHCRACDKDDEDKLCDLEEQTTGVRPEKGNAKRYRTVIMDSLSEIEQHCMNQILGITDVIRLHEETQTAEWTEYKKNHNMITRMVRCFRYLPMNVIFTSSEKFIQDENKRMKFSPNLTGKLSKSVQGFMDMVGYYVVGAMDDSGNTKRTLYVSPSVNGKYDAKHRYVKFKQDHFLNPTMETILKETGLLESSGAAIVQL